MEKNIKNMIIVGVIAVVLGICVYFLTIKLYQSCLVAPSDFLVNEDIEM